MDPIQSLIFSLPKLKENNYVFWKANVERILIARGLLGYVNGRFPEPSEEKERDIWIMKDAETSSILMSGLEGDNMRIAVKSKTSKQLWDGLANKFESKNLNNLIDLQTSYFQTKQKSGQSIEEHLNTLDDLADKLAAIGEPVRDEQKLVFLFNSLLPSYAQYIISIKAIPNLTYNIASSMLKDVDRMIKKANPENLDEGSSALVARKSNKEDKRRNSDQKRKCYYCKKEGHTSAECRSNPDAE